MAGKTRGFAHRIDISAGAGRIWRALTLPAELDHWCAPGASMQARPGGLFRASVDRVIELEAHIDVFEPERRLRLIFLPSPQLPPGESTIIADFILDEGREGTIVRVLGSGVPMGREWDTQYVRLRTGWERAMARLKVFVEKVPAKEASAP